MFLALIAAAIAAFLFLLIRLLHAGMPYEEWVRLERFKGRRKSWKQRV